MLHKSMLTIVGTAASALLLSLSAHAAGPLPAGDLVRAPRLAIDIQAPPGQPQPQPKAKSTAPAKSKSDQPADQAAAARPASEGQLRQRVEQIEEQLTDMQVVIGTLESLGKGGGAATSASPAARGGAGGGVDQARLDSLETQLRALTAQVEQLADQMRQMGGGRRGDAGSVISPAGGPAAVTPLGGQPPRAGVAVAATSQGGFGATTVNPSERESDPIGRLITTEPPAAAPPSAPSTPLPPAAAAAGNPKELYETAYGYLLQQDYGAAEVAFEEFLRRYGSDRLAADAQYWLGESLYVQRRYKPAGQAFLRVIEKYQASAKVPNSILKLAMSLEQLGQKDCALFTELETRHPTATADVKSKARSLKQRVGC